jgi:hypothetical protein
MENYNDLDTSLELEFESSQGSTAGSNCNEDKPSESLEPISSRAIYNDDRFNYSLSTIKAQLQAQYNATLLARLHSNIKA